VFAARRFPTARIWCFEPLASARSTLDAVVKDLPGACVFAAALSDSPGDREMHVTKSDDSSSLLAPTARQIEASLSAASEVATTSVEVNRLDAVVALDAIQRPALLKIDVQGAELDVLRGAEAVLAAFDEILVECSFVELYTGQALAEDVADFLRESGFRLVGRSPVARDSEGRALQADFLFRQAEEPRRAVSSNNSRIAGATTDQS
jgi:FkbM family methyltransferase